MNNKDFVSKLKEIAKNKTVYANGMFGQPITESIIAQKTRQLPKWYTSSRQKSLRALIGKGYFGFDCICFIKSALWGWNGNLKDTNGGAKYCSNGVPDISEYGMMNACNEISSDFSKIEIGEYLWTDGHCGVYIGDGLAIECTPKWENGVQITAVLNIGEKEGYNGRVWKKHGKLPYIEYVQEEKAEQNTDENVTIKLLTLRKGKYTGNAQILTVQRILKSLGYYKGSLDGDFGNKTFEAVEGFQAENGLEIDGIVGCNTWGCLLKG